jgi:DNA-dependent metalloprotease WSS1
VGFALELQMEGEYSDQTYLQHMNHGAGFQSLMAELKNEVRMLQQRGYFGDGEFRPSTLLAD